jgi:hypothetical protein
VSTLFVAWRNPITRAWYPVGKLTYEGIYSFCYVNGALNAMQEGGFCPFPSFPDIHQQYYSRDLFPLFSNRVMSRSRPDYPAFIDWMSIAQDRDDPMALLARSGGERATDTLELFPCPEKDSQGNYHAHFFSHGLRHMSPASRERVGRLEPGERLRLMHDFQNRFDPDALLLRTDEREPGDLYLVGFLPSYLLEDIHELLKQRLPDLAESVVVRVERVNLLAPLQFRLLCSITMPWTEGFQPFDSERYQSISKQGALSSQE